MTIKKENEIAAINNNQATREPNDGDENNNLESAKHLKKIYSNENSTNANDSGVNQVLNSQPSSNKVAPGKFCFH